MVFEILKRAASLNAESEFVKGKPLNGRYESLGKMVVFEDNYLRQSGVNPLDIDPSEFTVEVPYGTEPKIFSMRHVEALVTEGYAIFAHFAPTAPRLRGTSPSDCKPEKVSGVVYKLNKKGNKLTNYQFASASIFGLENSNPIVTESEGTYIAKDNQEYEDFLCAMTALGYIDKEDAEILQSVSISSF